MIERPIFALRVRAERGVDAIRALRAWLKNGLRAHGLRCLQVEQVNDETEDDNNDAEI